MNESKIELTHRLQTEGRWSEASLWKDQHFTKLHEKGGTRKEANRLLGKHWNAKFRL